AYFITDTEGKITKFNQMFYALFPKSVARKLNGKMLKEVMEIPMDIVTDTLVQRIHLRFDEVAANVPDMQEYRFILSSIPLFDEEKQLSGVLVLMRNVTDEATVQLKYQDMLESEAKQREILKDELTRRTESLVAISKKYFDLKEQMRQRTKGQLSPYIYQV
ncbi:PAS domain-containing protein, partial [Myxococcota bacterium]|nr:PAS domain-containing protein [Myxococcota bacterium]